MAAAKRQDSSTDVRINPVQLPSGEIVSWAEAFPRREMPVTVPVEARS